MVGKVVRARETGSSDPQPLSQDDVNALNSSTRFTASKDPDRPGMWTVKRKGGKAEVGSVQVGHLDVHIAPKLPIKRVLFLLGYTIGNLRRIRWQPDLAGLKDAEGLVPAFAQMLWRRADAALADGVLTGYVPAAATSTVLRGRLRETDQLYRSHGLGHPLQIQYDDLTVDIPENQILKAALSRMLGVRGIGDESYRAIIRLLSLLAGVTALLPHAPAPSWAPNRLNLRYAEALALAELVLQGHSAEHGAGITLADGFLVDMEDIFEDFVRNAIGNELVKLGGGEFHKPKDWYLDTTSKLKIEPDLAWTRNGGPAALVDAKYMTQRPTLGGDRNGIFQMLTYCTATGLKQGHLVYPAGTAEPTTYTVQSAGIEILCHALNLDQEPTDLLTQVKNLASQIAAPVFIGSR